MIKNTTLSQEISQAMQEIRPIKKRLDGAEAMMRMLYRMQVDHIVAAEKLRKTALAALAANKRGHREIQARERLWKLVESMKPFPMPKALDYLAKWKN